MFAWGCGPCLGTGSVDATSARPRLIDELQSTFIIDIAAGDSHCLALSKGKYIMKEKFNFHFCNTGYQVATLKSTADLIGRIKIPQLQKVQTTVSFLTVRVETFSTTFLHKLFHFNCYIAIRSVGGVQETKT